MSCVYLYDCTAGLCMLSISMWELKGIISGSVLVLEWSVCVLAVPLYDYVSMERKTESMRQRERQEWERINLHGIWKVIRIFFIKQYPLSLSRFLYLSLSHLHCPSSKTDTQSCLEIISKASVVSLHHIFFCLPFFLLVIKICHHFATLLKAASTKKARLRGHVGLFEVSLSMLAYNIKDAEFLPCPFPESSSSKTWSPAVTVVIQMPALIWQNLQKSLKDDI